MAGVVFVNPEAGPGATEPADLRVRFSGHDVEECGPEDLAGRVTAARDDEVDFVGVAGGDGSQRCVAEQLAGGDVPLLPIPAGTRNHFAKDLGIRTIEDAATVAGGGRVERVDVGRVNGRVFLNNSSLGIYPRIVVSREARQLRLRKGVATVVAAVEQIRRGRRLEVDVDGETAKAWLVFVGNGRYGEGLLDLADRESLRDGELDVRVVRADQPLARLRVVGALLLGRLAGSPLVITRATPGLVIDVHRRRRIEVALDGEVEEMGLPLRYECVEAALPVLIPPV
jgi:diacylglycerol kinase family enzyme